MKTLPLAAIATLSIAAAALAQDNPLNRPAYRNPSTAPNSNSPLHGPQPLVSDSLVLPTLVVWQGITYRITGLRMANDDSASFFTDHGQLKIPIDQLPANVTKNYGDKIKKAQAELLAARRAAMGITTVEGSVITVTRDGLLLSGEDGAVRFLRDYRKQVADGDRVVTDAVADGIFQYPNPLGGASTVHAYRALNQ